jgi:hypothetical protein
MQLNRSQGTIAVYESNVGKNKAELNQPQYKDIEKRYSTQLIQLKVNAQIHLSTVVNFTYLIIYFE